MGIGGREPQLCDLAGTDKHRLGLPERDALRIVALRHRPRRAVRVLRRSHAYQDAVRILRQRGIAKEAGFTGGMTDLLHAVCNVALRSVERSPVFIELHHDTDMIRRAVPVIIEKYEVALLREIRVGAPVQPRHRQRRAPLGTVGSVRNDRLRNAAVTQAEGGKHSVPVAVRLPVPLAETGNALHFAVFGHKIVLRAFFIAELRLRNGSHIVGPNACPLGSGNAALPDGCVFDPRVRIGVAGKGVLVRFLLADQPLLVACVRMDVARLLRSGGFFTDQDGRFRIASLRVRMALGLLRRAGQVPVRVVAVLAVRVLGSLLQAAAQNLLRLVARVCVHVRRLRGLGFLLPADQDFFIAVVRMLMGLLSAKGIARYGDRRKDQRIGRAEHDKAGQNDHDLPPVLFVKMLLYVPLNLLG